jgi:lipopolysaccharide cholinephosphotransferase
MARNRELEKIREVNMKLIRVVDRICKEHGISYFLFAGTLLGAVREKDFIPWDDDVDICFVRSEYEKFIRVAPAELPKEMELVLPGETKAFYDMIAKLNYKESRLHNPCEEDSFYEDKYCRIALDLYIMDQTYSGSLARKIHIFRLKTLYGMLMSKRYRLDWSKYSRLEYLQVKVLTLMGKPFSTKTLVRRYERVSTEVERSRKAALSGQPALNSNSFIPKIGVVYEKDWFTGTVDGSFHGETYPLPVGYDGYLSHRYGDYMKPSRQKGDIVHLKKGELMIDGELI